MVLVQGSWRMVVVYGLVSIALLVFAHFAFSTPHHGPSSPALQRINAKAQADGRKADTFNACLRVAGTNLRKTHACQRAYQK